MRIKFKNPPINELVVGLYFASEVTQLRAEHIGLFWSSIRTEFPKIQQQPVLMPPTSAVLSGLSFAVSLDTEVFPMPRYWLEASDDAYLMQIQRDAFIYNWRKRGAEYPHFVSVKAGFDHNFARYTEFLAKEFKIAALPISVAELTYINLIEPCEYWKGPQDTKSVIPTFSLPYPAAMTEGESNVSFSQLVVQHLAPDLTVRTTVRNVQKGTTPCLLIELRCSGNQSEGSKSAADQWYLRAHDVVGDCFLRMTSHDVQQKYWQPVE